MNLWTFECRTCYWIYACHSVFCLIWAVLLVFASFFLHWPYILCHIYIIYLFETHFRCLMICYGNNFWFSPGDFSAKKNITPKIIQISIKMMTIKWLSSRKWTSPRIPIESIELIRAQAHAQTHKCQNIMLWYHWYEMQFVIARAMNKASLSRRYDQNLSLSLPSLSMCSKYRCINYNIKKVFNVITCL